MTTISGVLEYDPRANKGGFYAVKINGTYYSAGKSDPGLRKGDSVTFDAEQNDRGYWNVKGKITKTGGVSPSAARGGSATPDKVFPVPARHSDRAFVRKDAVVAAVALVNATKHDASPATADHVVDIARIIEAYQAGDEEAEQDRAKAAAATARAMTGGGE